jgi:hypothetical protein
VIDHAVKLDVSVEAGNHDDFRKVVFA